MLAAIKKIINPNVVLDIATGDKRLTLKEQGADSKIKKLHIENVPENAFAFTLDHQPGRDNRWFKQLSCYFDISNDKGVNKGCDLILLVPRQDQWIVLVFDLKSKKPNKKATEKQLINSELFIRYVISIAQSHYGVDTSSVEYRRAIVTSAERKGIPKSATYRPNEKTSAKDPFHIAIVRIHKNKEPHVPLGSLLA